jgi:hypothetical protein
MMTDQLVGPSTSTDSDDRKEGDIVAYDFDLDGIYEHVGVLVDMSPTSSDDWKVVSSIGLIEIFKYGAQNRRLHVFGSTNGGEFTSWISEWENYATVFFYVNPNTMKGWKNEK